MACVVGTGCTPADDANVPSEDTNQPVARVPAPKPAAEPQAAPTERIPEEAELKGAWLLEDLAGRGVMDIVQTTIAFDAEGGVSGSGGCNRFNGSYTFEDGRLVFSPMAATKKMCPEAVMNQEDGFHRSLGVNRKVAIDGPYLLIYIEDTDAPLRFTRMSEEDGP
jgi:putative lipoprotein